MTSTQPAPMDATQPINYGRRATDFFHGEGERLTFGKYVDKLYPIAITGLLGWLCLSTMDLKQAVALLVQRSNDSSSKMDSLVLADKSHEKDINALKVQAARHGWKPED